MGRRSIEVRVFRRTAMDWLSLNWEVGWVTVSVCTSTARTSPSWPVNTFSIFANTQWFVKVLSLVTITMSPGFKFGLVTFHFPAFWRCWRYSADHRFQKWWIIDWQSVHRLQSDGSSVVTVSGYACRGRPTRKCPGVRTSIPSWLWLVVAHRGLELRQASICVRMVENSSKSSLWSPITRRRWCLVDFTAASQKPPKCGALSGIQCQFILLDNR